MAHDPVNHPRHYTSHPSGVECIVVTEHMNFCLGNALKYIWRAGEKGDAIEDLMKARWYVDREIARLQAQRATGSAGAAGVADARGAVAPPAARAPNPPPVLPRQNAPAAAGAARVARAANGRGWRTEARLAVLRRDWPTGRPTKAIRAEMNAMDGPPVPHNGAVATWAGDLNLKRPEALQRRKLSHQSVEIGWAGILAWAETVDPDLVLRGDVAARLAQVNELRALESLPPFVLPPDAPVLAPVWEAA